MSLANNLLIIALLIACSAFFSVSEISLAAARKIRLRQMADDGNVNASRVLRLQEQPGHFFTVVQIGLNAVAILGGILGEAAFTPTFAALFRLVTDAPWVGAVSFACSFMLVTSLFILIADLMPKRLAMNFPEAIAVRVVRPMLFCVRLLLPLVWFFNGLANAVFRLFGVPLSRKDEITSDDIFAVVDAGAEAGVLHKSEHQVIENVFELESRTVPSAMTQRESIVFFSLDEPADSIKAKISEQPHSKFLVCDHSIDSVIGYADSKDILRRVLSGERLSLKEQGMIKTVLMVPDTLSLSEVLERFKTTREDFAVILNEYALVVGIITLNDVMSTVMGDLIGQNVEEQIVKRDEHSWLVDGMTPVEDVLRALELDSLPDDDSYETVAGFMMYMLRKIPRRTDCVVWEGYKFEVVDIDNHKIDQILVTRQDAAGKPEPSLA
ncbi:hemolysin family protein [Crenobacter intestini]|uniref:Polyamine export protein n=1 Tax=Crenobacter intestini TaxID=2563443 RepID=A0A4T0V3K1_9NEIS|nr:hemolysin family protein [Crenobacter intestini]TIC86218.1 HlyC/CorC family transporter [Crenobacter intestini]